MDKQSSPLTDSFDRHHNYLRSSLTERCNLRCSYCMPLDGVKLSPAEHLMNSDEIFSIAKTFVKFGVTKIRLTGGEPLVRKDFPRILELLSTLNTELSLTTNAVSIDRHFEQLKKAGVKTVNISLDTLNAERFHDITFRNYFDRVYQNILKLIEEGFIVKINAVLMRGVNEDEILDFIAFTKDQPVAFRFIEFMPLDADETWEKSKVMPQNEILDLISSKYELEPLSRGSSPAARWKFVDGPGEIGIIATVSEAFCDACDRIRLTADGKFRNCLFAIEEYDVRKLLRENVGDEKIIELFSHAVKQKWAGHQIGKSVFIRPSNSTPQTGG